MVLFNSSAEENLGFNPPPSLNLRGKKIIRSHVPIIKRDNNNNNNIKGKKDGPCNWKIFLKQQIKESN